MKPHRGRLAAIGVWEYSDGYVYHGHFLDHPEFAGKYGRTSKVVRDDKDLPRHADDGYEIETLNSRYTIVPSLKIRQEATALVDV